MTTAHDGGGESNEHDRPEREPGRDPPRIYAASLSDYNHGRLHGEWIDAAQEPVAIGADIDRMLATSRLPGAEEWAIHDYEGFGPLRLSEYESLERISQLGLGIAEHGDAFAAYADVVDDDPELLAEFEEHYLGRWDSLTDYAASLLGDLGADDVLEGLPEWLAPYVTIDAEAYGRDLALGGDILHTPAADGGLHVFAANRE